MRSVEDELLCVAETNPDRFLKVFRILRETQTEDVTRACLRYLADHEPDHVGQSMRIWLSGGNAYLDLLLDPTFLSVGQARRVVGLLRDSSLAFVGDLQKQLLGGQVKLNPERLDRAVQILPGVIDSGVLIPWLRNLIQTNDEHLRSKAAKALCVMRPNLMMVERQLRSEDARVRANAIEALWETKTPEAIRLLNDCLADSSHRVVVNALIGLHRNGVASAFSKLLALADSPTPMMRRAALWGMQLLDDLRAVATVRKLTGDSVEEVRSKAAMLLQRWTPETAAEEPALEIVPTVVEETEAVVESAPAVIQPPVQQDETKWGRKKSGVLKL